MHFRNKPLLVNNYGDVRPAVSEALHFFGWVALIIFVVRVVDAFVFDVLMSRRRKVVAPQLLRQIVAIAIYLLLFVSALRTIFDIDIRAAFTTGAVRVAERLDLPDDWLNDGAKGYLVGVTKGEVLYKSTFLIVRAASLPQLLAMKLAAWRDALDRDDAKLLLSRMPGSASDVWDIVKPLVPPDQSNKASYAFQDLWEAIHGAP